MKILILGSTGQLGFCLCDQFLETNYDIIAPPREQLDIGDLPKTLDYILSVSPNIVINAAAYTQVDLAETNQEVAKLINHIAVANIAEACRRINAWLIHFSTNYVFDGIASTSYQEHQKPKAPNFYGLTKLNGENSIRCSGCQYIIVRTAWVFSQYGVNFFKTILQKADEGERLRLVSDQIGCPTLGQDVAAAILKVISVLKITKNLSGIYHFCGNHPCSWYEFGKAIFARSSVHGRVAPKIIEPILSDDYPTQARRPAYAVLNCKKFNATFNSPSADFNDALDRVFLALKGQN